jgi:hypothetical protein
MSVATFVPSSAVWWAAYGVYQKLLAGAWLRCASVVAGGSPPRVAGPGGGGGSGASGHGAASPAAGGAGALDARPGPHQPASVQPPPLSGDRLAPSAAAWFAWALPPSLLQEGTSKAAPPAPARTGQGTASDAHGSSSTRGPTAASSPRPNQPVNGGDTALQGGSGSAGVHVPITMGKTAVASVQLAAALLAGATASLITNPLDLVKTRIQVAVKSEGQSTSWRAVLAELLREEGPSGLLRGAAPRMLSSAMWGTAMVMVSVVQGQLRRARAYIARCTLGVYPHSAGLQEDAHLVLSLAAL